MAEMNKNPTAPGKASVGSDIAYRVGSDLDITTYVRAINGLRARLCFSDSAAALAVELTGICRQVVRS